MGINFTNLDDLANRLTLNPLATPEHVSGKPITKGQIGRLAINVHGTIGGQLLINGKNRPPLTARNIEEWRRQLEDIGLATTEHAMILFMGCNAGLGKDGTELLKALSTIWRDRQVVAFFTIGFAMGGEMKRRGQACTEPGMRVTDYVYASRDPRLEEETKKKWKNLQELPWAWEESKSAKVALNGEILRGVGF